MNSPPVVLTIAGVDSGGAAGIAADLTTFCALGVHGACVVAAVTAQDTTGVHAIHTVPLEMVEAQLDAVLTDLDPAAVKTGMLGTPEAVRLVAQRCADRTLVVDPVLRATSGAALASEDVLQAYIEYLLPVATVVTPNRIEAEALGAALSGVTRIVTGGPEWNEGVPGDCVDVITSGDIEIRLTHKGIATRNDHGTGCTYSAALAANLALGIDLVDAAQLAADFTAEQLLISQHWTLGRGRGPVAHTQPPMEEYA